MSLVRRALRRSWLLCAPLLLTLLALELGAFALLAWLPSWPSRAEVQASLTSPAADAKLPDRIVAAGVGDEMGNAVHPYLGFVRRANPGQRNTVNGRPVDLPVNRFGFFGPEPPFEPDPARVRVGITGGSVATELFLYGREAMAERLRELGVERADVFSLALGGMKQPQQLMALNWFLALGARFDVLVNLDGFNELTLALEQAEFADTFPAYPIRWQVLAAQRVDLPTVELVGRIAAGREERDRWRAVFSRPVLRHSSLALAVWNAMRTRAASREAELEAALAERGAKGTFQTRGPELAFDSRPALFEHASGVWRRASRQMWQVASGHRIAYLHFLQPSQYVPDSKRLTERERRRAFREQSGPQVAVGAGYPLLQRGGRRLAREGVAFRDLTGIFRDETRQVYRDECCHLNERGYGILARAIADEIAGAVRRMRRG